MTIEGDRIIASGHNDITLFDRAQDGDLVDYGGDAQQNTVWEPVRHLNDYNTLFYGRISRPISLCSPAILEAAGLRPPESMHFL